MAKDNLHIEFERAFDKACSEEQADVPIDVQLYLYAYYKRAIDEPYVSNRSFQSNDLRGAFKMNALIQVQSISKAEAKKRYIAMVQELYPKPW